MGERWGKVGRAIIITAKESHPADTPGTAPRSSTHRTLVKEIPRNTYEWVSNFPNAFWKILYPLPSDQVRVNKLGFAGQGPSESFKKAMAC